AFNRTTVPPVYDEIRRTLSGAYSVTLDSLNYLLNASGHRFFPNRYEAVEPVRGLRLLAIRENGLWGLADSSGRVLLPPQLDERFYLNPNKQAIVKQAGKYGLMDTTGAWRLQPEWDEIRNAAPPSTGYQLRRNSLWGLADRTGIVLLPPAYDWFSAEGRPGNLLLTKQQGKYGLINHRGELLLQAEYAGIYLGRREFDPYILVLKNDRYGLVDSLGRIRIPVDFQWIAPFSADLVWVKQEERWGLWDLQRDSLRSPPRYRDHRRLSEGLCAVKVGEKWGFIDSTGRMTLEPQYLDAQNFSEGLAPVRQISEQNQATQSFWGYIDRQGNWVIPPIFFQAQEFQEGRAPAEESGKGWGLIDRAGQWVIEPQYHGISPCIGGRVLLWELPENARQYLYGVASCKGRLFLTPEYESVRLWGAEGWYFCQYKKENGRYGLIDAGGRHWLPEGLDEIRHMASGFAVRMGERWSWAPLTGGPATPFVFENIRDVERAILFWQNGKIGMLAPNGQVVLPAQFSNLHLNTSYLPNSYHLSGPWGSIQLNARGEYILEAEPGAARR
ncbi:MAG: WG repeat-containing protein, partial [Saprospiraceae bacterium]|nr:WG repeat-containing protein [Saprospiraceae bacterium]